MQLFLKAKILIKLNFTWSNYLDLSRTILNYYAEYILYEKKHLSAHSSTANFFLNTGAMLVYAIHFNERPNA